MSETSLTKALRSIRRRKTGEASNASLPSQLDHRLLANVLINGRREVASEDSPVIDPYIDYVCSRLVSEHPDDAQPDLHSLIGVFALLVEYFTQHPRATVEQFLNLRKPEIASFYPIGKDPQEWRRARVINAVNAISLWLAIEEFNTLFYNEALRKKYFALKPPADDIQLATNVEELAVYGRFSIPTFAAVAGLLPTIDPWVNAPGANPWDEIPKSQLNARLILRIGQIKLKWTFDISKHMQYEHPTLSLFCIPSRFAFDPEWQKADTPDRALTSMGFRREYVDEVQRSYLRLFGPQLKPLFEDEFCSDDFPQPKDPYLERMCLVSPDRADLDKLDTWQKSEFRYLWPRIKMLEQHVQSIRPDSFWKLLYRDRRDSLAWYTFVFAVLVLMLTLMSTVFTGIQTVKAFLPSSPPSSDSSSGLSSTSTSPNQHSVLSTTSVSSSTTTTATTTFVTSVLSSITSTMANGTPAPTPTAVVRQKGLTTGAKAGIGVGVSAGVIALIGTTLIFYRRARIK